MEKFFDWLFGRNKRVCVVCGKKIKGWGIDGCPHVNKGSEISVLTTNPDSWIHYDCM